MTKINLYVNSFLSKLNPNTLGIVFILGIVAFILSLSFFLGFLDSNLSKHKLEEVLSKNEAQELCGNISNAGKYQFEYSFKRKFFLETEPASIKIICPKPNKSKQPQSIIKHPILVAKLLTKENKKEFLGELYGEKSNYPEKMDLQLSIQMTRVLINKRMGYNYVDISYKGIPTIANGRSATSVMECKSTIFNDSLTGVPWITVDKIYNDYFVRTHDINEFKQSRSEIADELIKIINCLNRTEINELKNAESWQ